MRILIRHRFTDLKLLFVKNQYFEEKKIGKIECVLTARKHANFALPSI